MNHWWNNLALESAANQAWNLFKKINEDDILQEMTLVSSNLSEILNKRYFEWRNNPERLNLEMWIELIISRINSLLLVKESNTPIVLLVAWWSSSWKTSKVADEVMKFFLKSWITTQTISMDSFYFGPSYMRKQRQAWNPINYDEPQAINIALLKEKLELLKKWETILIPDYNFRDDPVPEAIEINPSKIIIVEWLFTLQDDFYDIWDLWVFVEVSAHWRLIRRIIRDSLQWRTTKTPTQVFRDVFKEVEPMDDKHVKPQIPNANIVISNDYTASKEAPRITNTEYQTKYPLLSIQKWIKSQITPLLKLKQILISYWFQEQIWTTHEDVFFESKAWYESNWEVFRLRDTNKKGGNPQVTYKYSEKEGEERYECILSFPIEEVDKSLLDSYYKRIWKITKKRTKYSKDWITITIDTDVQLQLEWGRVIEIWNFVEVQWKNEALVKHYKKVLEEITLNRAIDKSYFEMMQELKGK